jgi:biopolymer transport protein ExbD
MLRSRPRRRSRWVSSLQQPGGINLTSMMDILTTLLLFILKSYVVEGEAMVPPPGVELPRSSAAATPQSSLVIAIDGQSILLGDERVATVAEAVAGDDPMIAPLAARLEAAREQQDRIDALRAADREPLRRVVTIQGDRDIEYRVLRRVMYTLNSSGYENVSLAVLKNS